MTDDLMEDPRIEQAIFGREVTNFVENDTIGQYIIARAKADLEEAQGALLIVEPSDSKAIMAAQFKARIANAVRGWLADAIRDGRAAEELIQQERDTRE